MPCICCGSNELTELRRPVLVGASRMPPEGEGKGGKGECKGTAGAVRALEPLLVVKAR